MESLPRRQEARRERALAEQRADADAVNKNIARLPALRLEREASAPPPEKEVKKPEKKQPESLARYLKHQKAIGR
jgi:hypothetical protein